MSRKQLLDATSSVPDDLAATKHDRASYEDNDDDVESEDSAESYPFPVSIIIISFNTVSNYFSVCVCRLLLLGVIRRSISGLRNLIIMNIFIKFADYTYLLSMFRNNIATETEIRKAMSEEMKKRK